LNRLNRFLAKQPGVAGSFITVFYGVLDSNTGQLHCASAGHEPPVLIRKEGEPEFLYLSGVPCGIFPELECSEMRLALQAGDRFLLYSDGVTEARRDRKLFDFEGLEAALKEEAGHRPDTLVRRIYRKVLRYSGGAMRDDVALLIVEFGDAESGLEANGLPSN
jgi:sigma-B regulation protein RsbU (phosphoserine phosphatase)